MAGRNLLALLEEPKVMFNKAMDGENSLDLFLDRTAIYGSERHPALQAIIEQIEKRRSSKKEQLLQKQAEFEELQKIRGSTACVKPLPHGHGASLSDP